MKNVCVVCGRRGEDVEPCFFRVVGGTYLVMAAVVRWVNLQTFCCEECFEQGRRITNFRMRAVLFFILWPLLPIALGYVLSVAGHKEVGFGILYGGALLFLPLLVLLPFYVGWGTRRRIRAFLPEELDQRLRDIGNIRRWGFGKHLVVLEELPRNETAIVLPEE